MSFVSCWQYNVQIVFSPFKLIVQIVSFDTFDLMTFELEQAKESLNLHVFILYRKYELFGLFFPV